MKKLLCILACLVAASSVMAAVNVYWNNTDLDNDWANPNNWDVGYVPTNDSLALINRPSFSSPGGDCAIGSGDRIAQVVYVYTGTFSLAAGATLSTADSGRYTLIGNAAGSSTANIAGDWAINDTCGMFVGFAVDASATLNVTDGSLTGYRLRVGDFNNAVGKVNLLGGIIEVTAGDNFVLGANGSMQIEGAGELILAGNRTNLVNGYITSGLLYTEDPLGLGVVYKSILDKTYVTVGAKDFSGMSMVVIGWDGTNGVNYTLQSKTDLIYDPSWDNLISGIPGVDGSTSATTTTTVAESFYRVILE